MLLLNLSLLIDVTFSTPTGLNTSLRRLFAFLRFDECYGDVSAAITKFPSKSSLLKRSTAPPQLRR
jgi:hypothetical protein